MSTPHNPNRRRASRRRPQGGTAAVEFALVLPLLRVVALALVQVGLLARDRPLVEAAARAGACGLSLGVGVVALNDPKGDAGAQHRKYASVRFPAHHDDLCDARAGGGHRQWDARSDGCLLDAERLSWRELQAEQQANPRRYRMLNQQEDVDPAGALVDLAWIEGGTDREGFQAPGCNDVDRALGEWPASVSGLVDLVTVDPSAGGYWGILWLAYQPETKATYLIRGIRSSTFRPEGLRPRRAALRPRLRQGDDRVPGQSDERPRDGAVASDGEHPARADRG